MDQLESLSHSVWECKYHVSFIPKCRRRVLYEGLRQHLGEVFRRLAEQKESRVLEGHLMADHVQMLLSIPPNVCGVGSGGLHQGQECDSSGTDVQRTQAEFHWSAFLGARLFCVNRGTRRNGDPRIYPQSGSGGQAADQLKMWK